jgi:hypothetical protein
LGTGAADAANKSADTTVPTMVAGDALFAVVTPRAWHTCGLSTTGNALCWGGDMFQMKSPAPARVQLPDQVLTSTTGTFHDCALTRRGIAYCWEPTPMASLAMAQRTMRYHPRNLSPPRECSLFKAADDAALRTAMSRDPAVSMR